MNKKLEKYYWDKEGFSPIMISANWQVAIINYGVEFEIENFSFIDLHLKTDEAFVLLNGSAVLLSCQNIEVNFDFELTTMEEGKIYKIPKRVWHYIFLKPNSKVLIVEDINSHLGEYERVNIPEGEIGRIQKEYYRLEK